MNFWRIDMILLNQIDFLHIHINFSFITLDIKNKKQI
jgi:hypothetical protein